MERVLDAAVKTGKTEGVDTGVKRDMRPSRIFAALCLLPIGILAVGCFRSPSDDAAKKELQAALQEGSEAYSPVCGLSVERFEKTNGLESVTDGAKRYAFDFSADLSVTKPCCEIKGFGNSTRYAGCKQVAFLMGERGTPIPPASMLSVTGTLLFVKKESGWVREGARMLTTTVVPAGSASAAASHP